MSLFLSLRSAVLLHNGREYHHTARRGNLRGQVQQDGVNFPFAHVVICHVEVGRTAGVHGNVHPVVTGGKQVRSGEVLTRGHYVALVSIDGRNLTATFLEHYSLVRMGMNALGLVIVLVVFCLLPFVVVCCVDRRGENGAGARIDRELGHRFVGPHDFDVMHECAIFFLGFRLEQTAW